jgi:hypothetical protein
MLSQEIGVIIWNASVPLLQGHLRLKVRICISALFMCFACVCQHYLFILNMCEIFNYQAYSALKSVSTCLDAVSSPLVQLRSQLHFELTKVEIIAQLLT